MSISDEISRITNARDDIGDAIEEMGVEVPSGTQIDGMASLIRTGVTGHIQDYNNPHQVTPEQIGAANVDILTAPTQTASGPMVSFTADMHSILNECTVNIEPVQDLHGYEYPWPAGGGSNQLDFNNCAYARCTLVDAKTGSVKLNITDNYYASINLEGSQLPTNMINRVLNGDPITLSVVGNLESSTIGIIAYGDRSNGTAYQESSINGNTVTLIPSLFTTVTRIELRLCRKGSKYTDTGTVISEIRVIYGSSSVPFAPYSNICPISGRNKINIWSTSKNLFKENLIALGTKQTINGVTFKILETGKILPSGTVTSSDAILKLGTVTLPPGEYKAYGIDGVDGSSSTYRLVITNSAFTQAIATVTTSSGTAFTLTETTTIGYQIVISVGVTINYTNVVFTPMILVSTDVPGMFGRYAGTQYPITFPSSAGTVYGGTLDVTNGVLTVDREMVDLGTLNWAQYRTVRGWYAGSNKIKAGTNKIKCTSYRSVASSTDSSFYGDSSNDKCINTYLNGQGLRIMDTAYEDTATFKASLSGVQLVYELETPIVYNITARQIYYYPASRIWTDTDSISVRYQATGRNALLTHVSTPVSNLQGQINISGLLKSNGDGDIVTAIPGQDYAVSKNLLRNWYFAGGGTGRGVLPVNQRGQSSYTATGSSTVRAFNSWRLIHGVATLLSGSVNIQFNSSAGNDAICEQLVKIDDLPVGIYTFSILLADGTMYSGTNTLVESTGNRIFYNQNGIRLCVNRYATYYQVFFGIASTAGIGIKAVKLESGQEQTLAHQEGNTWVPNEIPDYEEEFIKCQTSTADSTDTYANKSLATEQQIAYVETGTTASRAYAVGENFCWNGLLYRAKTAIASGAAFTPGTNCESVKLTTELNNKVYWGQSSTSYNVQGCSIRKVSDSRIILTLLTGGVDATGPGTMRLDVQSTGIRFERYDGSNWVLLKQWA